VTVQTVTASGPGGLGRVIAYGQAGNDVIDLLTTRVSGGPDVALAVPAYLFGGDGDDDLDAGGGAATNVLLGGAGKDRLWGGAGRDLLIGGEGEDRLRAGGGGSLLIGGTTDYDTNLVALSAVAAEWGRGDLGYNVRVGHLGGQPGGLNGPYVLTTATVHDDAASDDLFGGNGLDWFFARLSGPAKDKVVRDPSESIVLL
jgi:Ca2+-binding RTX toxin-like protein